jgi:hypothetical protein
MKIIFYILLSLFLTTTPLIAQQASKQNSKAANAGVLQTGKPLPGSSRIAASISQFVLYILDNKGNKQFVSMLSRVVEMDELEGEQVIRVTQRYDSSDGINTDTSIFRRRSLEPLSYQADLTTGKESFVFKPQMVEGILTSIKGDSKKITVPLKEPLFNAVAIEELVLSLPLKAAPSISVKLYNPGKTFLNSTFRVVQSTKLQSAGTKPIEVWVVEMKSEASLTTLWISKQTQKLIMQKSKLKNGSEFYKVRLYADV